MITWAHPNGANSVGEEIAFFLPSHSRTPDVCSGRKATGEGSHYHRGHAKGGLVPGETSSDSIDGRSRTFEHHHFRRWQECYSTDYRYWIDIREAS